MRIGRSIGALCAMLMATPAFAFEQCEIPAKTFAGRFQASGDYDANFIVNKTTDKGFQIETSFHGFLQVNAETRIFSSHEIFRESFKMDMTFKFDGKRIIDARASYIAPHDKKIDPRQNYFSFGLIYERPSEEVLEAMFASKVMTIELRAENGLTLRPDPIDLDGFADAVRWGRSERRKRIRADETCAWYFPRGERSRG